MKLTRTQQEFLQNLKALNTGGVYPSVLQVASATENSLSWGQILYRYKICNQLISMGLVCDRRSGRRHELAITEGGLQAIQG